MSSSRVKEGVQAGDVVAVAQVKADGGGVVRLGFEHEGAVALLACPRLGAVEQGLADAVPAPGAVHEQRPDQGGVAPRFALHLQDRNQALARFRHEHERGVGMLQSVARLLQLLHIVMVAALLGEWRVEGALDEAKGGFDPLLRALNIKIAERLEGGVNLVQGEQVTPPHGSNSIGLI